MERFWRTIKYDFLFLYEFKGGGSLYSGIKWFIEYYNDERCHSSLEI
ncbi:integrase core domain-containing protein [Ilyobacter polytropus]